MKKSIRLICVSVLIMTAAFGLLSAQQDIQQKLRDRDRDRWMWQLPRQVMDKIGVHPGLDSDFRKEFSQQNTLMMIDKAGLDVISTETFLPVQDIYICKLRHWGQSSATASI
jgi:hypothetical protein